MLGKGSLTWKKFWFWLLFASVFLFKLYGWNPNPIEVNGKNPFLHHSCVITVTQLMIMSIGLSLGRRFDSFWIYVKLGVQASMHEKLHMVLDTTYFITCLPVFFFSLFVFMLSANTTKTIGQDYFCLHYATLGSLILYSSVLINFIFGILYYSDCLWTQPKATAAGFFFLQDRG